MVVELGPFPLCDRCQDTNGGLVATRHRQVHVSVAGRESCVDQGLAGVIAALWPVAGTLSCCEDDGGRAYVVPTADSAEAAEAVLAGLGLTVERTGDGVLRFALPPAPPAPPLPRVALDRDFPDVVDVARRFVAGSAEQLRTHTAGIEHPRIREARGQVAAAQEWLTAAMRRGVSIVRAPHGTLRPLGVVLQLVPLAAAAWTGASVGRLGTGGSTAWSLVGGIAAVFAVLWPILWLTQVVDDRTGRRRLARIPAAEDGPPVPAPGVLVPVDRRMDDVRAAVDAARTLFAVLAVRVPRHRFERRALTEAELALCQASDAIRIWLEAPRG